LKLVVNFCFQSLLKSATDCWTRSGYFKKMRGDLRALHVSLNNVSMSPVRKCLKRNNGHLAILQIECRGDIMYGERSTKLFETFI